MAAALVTLVVGIVASVALLRLLERRTGGLQALWILAPLALLLLVLPFLQPLAFGISLYCVFTGIRLLRAQPPVDRTALWGALLILSIPPVLSVVYIVYRGYAAFSRTKW